MPRHVDLTANVERTPEELLRITHSLDEINAVIAGYPALNERWYVPLDEEVPSRHSIILGREVRIFDIPSGYDATSVPARLETVKAVRSQDFLFGAPDTDLPTGDDWALPEEHPTVVRAIQEHCRDFTQHLQPLVPGWKQLLALRNSKNEPLGMPTGIGWYTHYWLSPMCDGVTMRLSEASDDIEVLLYKRGADNQSEAVWATPGGYVITADTQHPGITPLQAASARRAAFWTKGSYDILPYEGVPLHAKLPVSSGNTIVAGLETKPYGRFVHNPNYRDDPRITNADLTREAGFISLRDLCKYNPVGGASGIGHTGNPFPIWTTHFEYVIAGLDAIKDSEHQYRLKMTDEQLDNVQTIIHDFEVNYPVLQR